MILGEHKYFRYKQAYGMASSKAKWIPANQRPRFASKFSPIKDQNSNKTTVSLNRLCVFRWWVIIWVKHAKTFPVSQIFMTQSSPLLLSIAILKSENVLMIFILAKSEVPLRKKFNFTLSPRRQSKSVASSYIVLKFISGLIYYLRLKLSRKSTPVKWVVFGIKIL